MNEDLGNSCHNETDNEGKDTESFITWRRMENSVNSNHWWKGRLHPKGEWRILYSNHVSKVKEAMMTKVGKGEIWKTLWGHHDRLLFWWHHRQSHFTTKSSSHRITLEKSPVSYLLLITCVAVPKNSSLPEMPFCSPWLFGVTSLLLKRCGKNLQMVKPIKLSVSFFCFKFWEF